jgi:hypothetical protein
MWKIESSVRTMLSATAQLLGFLIKLGGLKINATKAMLRNKTIKPPLSSTDGKMRIPYVQKERKSPSLCHGKNDPKVVKTRPMIKDALLGVAIEWSP